MRRLLEDIKGATRAREVARAGKGFWHRHKAGLAWLALVLLAAAGFFYVQAKSERADEQFCQLFRQTSQGQIDQYEQTVGYLKTGAGKKNTPFNKIISNVSLPQLESAIDKRVESYPEVCGAPPTRRAPEDIPPLVVPEGDRPSS